MHTKRHNIDLLVGFIDFDDDEIDTGLSFAIYDDNGDYSGNIMLARSSFDRLLDDAEQGARISYDDVLDDSSLIFLHEARIRDTLIELSCDTHRFTLDLSKIDSSDIETIKAQLKKLNYDNRFELSIDGEESAQN